MKLVFVLVFRKIYARDIDDIIVSDISTRAGGLEYMIFSRCSREQVITPRFLFHGEQVRVKVACVCVCVCVQTENQLKFGQC